MRVDMASPAAVLLMVSILTWVTLETRRQLRKMCPTHLVPSVLHARVLHRDLITVKVAAAAAVLAAVSLMWLLAWG